MSDLRIFDDSVVVPDSRIIALTDVRTAIDSPVLSIAHFFVPLDTRAGTSETVATPDARTFLFTDSRPVFSDSIALPDSQVDIIADTRTFSDSFVIAIAHSFVPIDNRQNFNDAVAIADYRPLVITDIGSIVSDSITIPLTHPFVPIDTRVPVSDNIAASDARLLPLTEFRTQTDAITLPLTHWFYPIDTRIGTLEVIELPEVHQFVLWEIRSPLNILGLIITHSLIASDNRTTFTEFIDTSNARTLQVLDSRNISFDVVALPMAHRTAAIDALGIRSDSAYCSDTVNLNLVDVRLITSEMIRLMDSISLLTSDARPVLDRAVTGDVTTSVAHLLSVEDDRAQITDSVLTEAVRNLSFHYSMQHSESLSLDVSRVLQIEDDKLTFNDFLVFLDGSALHPIDAMSNGYDDTELSLAHTLLASESRLISDIASYKRVFPPVLDTRPFTSEVAEITKNPKVVARGR